MRQKTKKMKAAVRLGPSRSLTWHQPFREQLPQMREEEAQQDQNHEGDRNHADYLPDLVSTAGTITHRRSDLD